MEHIEAARRFSAEIGGMDEDVKSYFYSLPPSDVSRLLSAYQIEYGRSAREYAEKTIPKWRSGEVAMSGLVAQRLFNLLPPRMPLHKKYELTKGLWDHFGPASKKMILAGPDATLDALVGLVRQHISEVVTAFKIPDAMERRFAWLAHGDVHVKQQLLNYLREAEKQMVVQGAGAQMGALLEKLRSDPQGHIGRMTHIFIIGKHELHVVFRHDRHGASLEAYRSLPPNTDRSNSVPWLVIGAIILGLIMLFGR